MTTNPGSTLNVWLTLLAFCGACWVAVVCSMMGRVLTALLIVIIALMLVIWAIYLIGRDEG